MARLTGITTGTPGRLLLGAGKLSVGGTDVGATTGDATFEIEKDIYFPQLNGALGNVASTGFVTRLVGRLKVTVAEHKMALIAAAVPGLYWSSSTSSETTLASSVGCIAASEYKAVVWTGQDCEGDTTTITLTSAIMVDNLSITFSDTKEAQHDLVFETVYSLSDPDACPFSIVIVL